jgi:Fur family ferric uptake transcriptional regulator
MVKKGPMGPERLFEAFLRERGFSVTQARRKIVQAVFSLHGHFDASELWQTLRNERISMSTIYRTLELLERAGLVRRTSLGEAHAHYEHILGRGDHGHLICSRCGKVIEFPTKQVRESLAEISERYGFHLDQTVVQGYGLCEACRRKEAG